VLGPLCDPGRASTSPSFSAHCLLVAGLLLCSSDGSASSDPVHRPPTPRQWHRCLATPPHCCRVSLLAPPSPPLSPSSLALRHPPPHRHPPSKSVSRQPQIKMGGCGMIRPRGRLQFFFGVGGRLKDHLIICRVN
jgi:hypothetical protein